MSFAKRHKQAWADKLAQKQPPARLEQTTSELSRAVIPAAEGTMEPDISGDKHALMQAAIEVDIARLKATNSHAKKDEIKETELLDKYRLYLKGIIDTGTGEDNKVLVSNMIWAIDVQDFDWAMMLGDYATTHQLAAPEDFTRDVRNIFCGEMSAWALKEQKANRTAEPWLSTVFGMSRDWDLVDKITAELYRAMGQEIEAEEPAKALDYYQQALQADDGAGVKPAITRLEKQLEANKA